MIKAAWNFLGTRMSYRIVSVLLCIYLATAEFGKTGSYWSLFNAFLMFYCIWFLGFGSARRAES